MTTTTGERLMKIETKLDAHLAQDRIEHCEIMEKLNSLESKFAGKWVEKVAIGLAIAGISVIITVVTLII